MHLVDLIDYLLQTRSSKVDPSGFVFVHLPLHSHCLPAGWLGAKPGTSETIFCHISVHNSLANFSRKKGLSTSKPVHFCQELPYFPVLWVISPKTNLKQQHFSTDWSFFSLPISPVQIQIFYWREQKGSWDSGTNPHVFQFQMAAQLLDLGLSPVSVATRAILSKRPLLLSAGLYKMPERWQSLCFECLREVNNWSLRHLVLPAGALIISLLLL